METTVRKTFKTTTILTAIVLELSVLGASAPSYAVTGGGNGSLASPAFPPDGVVKLGLGAEGQAQSFTAIYPSTPGNSAGTVSTESNERYYNSRSQVSHHF